MSYGKCPQCGANGLLRERRPNGNDKCENGHSYPSAKAVMPDDKLSNAPKQIWSAGLSSGAIGDAWVNASTERLNHTQELYHHNDTVTDLTAERDAQAKRIEELEAAIVGITYLDGPQCVKNSWLSSVNLSERFPVLLDIHKPTPEESP